VTKFLPNNWNAIRAFYREAEPEITAAGANEWGIDTYLWDGCGMIFFTPIETWLWADIRAVDAVLYPQYPVDGVFVDFGNPAAKVAIECDGADYHDARKDAERDARLEGLGWTVYRFPGWMCKTDSDRETGAPGEAHRRLQAIAERHGIDRKSRVRSDEDEDWSSLGDVVEQLVEGFSRRGAIVAAARRATR
jgi:hypothetical protein